MEKTLGDLTDAELIALEAQYRDKASNAEKCFWITIVRVIIDRFAKSCVVKKTIGKSIEGTDDHWMVKCPGCGREFEYEGFWDPEDVTECSCGLSFTTESIED